MWQFLQTYGIWIIGGIFLVLMIRMHSGGMGGMHGGGRGMNMGRSREEPSDTQSATSSQYNNTETQRAVPLDSSRHETVVRDINPEGKVIAADGSSRRRRSSC